LAGSGLFPGRLRASEPVNWTGREAGDHAEPDRLIETVQTGGQLHLSSRTRRLAPAQGLYQPRHRPAPRNRSL